MGSVLVVAGHNEEELIIAARALSLTNKAFRSSGADSPEVFATDCESAWLMRYAHSPGNTGAGSAILLVMPT